MTDSRRVQVLVRFGYDGTRFHGLQPQRELPTAGGALRARLEEASGQRARALQFAARTDAGVHALKNAATCWFVSPPDPAGLLADVERPRDDGLLHVRAELVPSSVHARGSARGKRYRYRVVDGSREKDLDDRYTWHVVPRLDAERMRAAAATLCGTHDFSSFRAARCSSNTPTKTLDRLRVSGPFDVDHGMRVFVFDLAGDAFLRKMVRILVGTLVEVGSGWRPADDVERVLAARDRARAGITAPARGLTLMEVGFAWPEDGSGLLPGVSGAGEAAAAPPEARRDP